MHMKTQIAVLIIASLFMWAGCQTGGPEQLTAEESQSYIQKGQNITKQVGMVMKSALTKSISEGGVAKAAQYCSYMAIPMVDTLAVQNGVSLRRTSTKVRNVKNDMPTERELVILEQYEQQKAAGQELKPLVELVDPHTVAYYQPILVEPLCLNCHGIVGETLTEDDFKTLKYLYPDDEATGYQLDDFRGIWSMQMPRHTIQ